MPAPYSQDLRDRVVAAVSQGSSARAAAARFGVSVSSAIRWASRWRDTRSCAALPMGGDHRSRLTAHRDRVLALVAARPELTVEEIRAELRAGGVVVGHGTVWRFLHKAGLRLKKNAARRRAVQA